MGIVVLICLALYVSYTYWIEPSYSLKSFALLGFVIAIFLYVVLGLVHLVGLLFGAKVVGSYAVFLSVIAVLVFLIYILAKEIDIRGNR